MGLSDIPDWASPALQGLAFWLGYQHSYGIGERLSEGAIATEFLRLMVAHRETGRVLEPEVLYRHIPELGSDPALMNSQRRADLVVSRSKRSGRTASFPLGAVEAIIEVKHNRSHLARVWEDIDFLGRQRSNSHSQISGFLIYVAVAKRPIQFTEESGAAPQHRIGTTPNHTRYKIRRVCRATARIPVKNPKALGHYALLIEVI